MDIFNDNRVVLTLDAGGTNFVFTAIKSGKEIGSSIVLSSNAHHLESCLNTIISGFQKIINDILPEKPVAISFAFPGPADYKRGIIGELINLPSFKGGVALGPMLENIFGLPTYINNDGDLFAYGEAIGGFLPKLNSDLKKNNIPKQYNNLFGITLGTGFGGGIIHNNQILDGDNSAGGEIWLMRNFKQTHLLVEEGVSIRAVQRVYAEESRDKHLFSPQEIYQIAKGEAEGNRQAAILAFEQLAVMVGESLANALTLIDGPVVIGGGISGAADLLLPTIVKHLNGSIENLKGEKVQRLVSKVYNVDDPVSYEEFLDWKMDTIKVPFSDKSLNYLGEKKLVVGLSHLGTSRAICLGAYAYALQMSDQAINKKDAPKQNANAINGLHLTKKVAKE